MAVLRTWAGLFLCLGCSTAADSGDPTLPDAATSSGAARPALCAREGRSDVVRDVFCSESGQQIASLAELQAALGVPEPVGLRNENEAGAVFLAHSTALSGEVVSELNPRAIVMFRGLFVAFNRGVQLVELAARDHSVRDQSNFYLLRFRQACNAAADGCGPADLYTASIESGWQDVSLADDEDLKNSSFDCRQCHQRGDDKPVLLMREYYSPWTHFFGPDQDEPKLYPEPTGSALLRDYLRAKGDEPYAHVSPEVMKSTIGLTLELLVDAEQPLLFEGSKIIGERWPWQDGYASVPVRSETWDNAYAAFKRGEQLPLPFYAPRATDPDKQARLTQAYQRYRAGELPAAELPDLADIFPDDPQLRAEIGLATEPSATPAETLVQACGTCHNDVLDQTLSRARFNIALGRMPRAELELAVVRMQVASSDAGVMPPAGRRQIPADKLAELIAYLQQAERPADDDALLERAAQLGMTGGATHYPQAKYPAR
jgi:cytochrome c553